ncbi:hypothetical protein QTP88_007209 [Uroleucon formosanum]
MFDVFNIKKQKLVVTDSSSTTTLESENEELNIGLDIDKTAQKSVENIVDKNVISDLRTLLTGPVRPILTLSVCSGTKGGNKSKLNKLDAHAKSNLHLTCMVKWSAYQKTKETGSVYSQISSQHSLMVKNNRMYMKMLVDIVLFLSCQGIGFRGHDETKDSLNQGNFKDLCKLLEKSNEEFRKKFNLKTNYTSHIIQDGLINICADVVKDIEDVEVFGIMCDEARCYKQEQMALCVRYVKNLDVVERFLGFIDCSKNQDAESLYQYILWYLKMCKISSKPQIVAESYDGANVMSGKFNGLQNKIKSQYPYAIYTHCMAHKMNLIVLDTWESKNIMQGVMMTFKNSRTTEYFSKLWCEIEIFAKDNEISIQTPSEGCKRKRQEPHNLKHFDTTATTSAEQNINDTSETIEDYFRKNAFFPVFDTILINLEKRFSAESLQMATAVDQFIQLNFEESLFFVDHYKDLMNVSKEVLQSEKEVAKNCILQSTDKKNITLNHAKKVLTKQTFPNLYKLFQVALTIPISSSTLYQFTMSICSVAEVDDLFWLCKEEGVDEILRASSIGDNISSIISLTFVLKHLI